MGLREECLASKGERLAKIKARRNLASKRRMRRVTMKVRVCALRAALLTAGIALPVTAWTAPPTPTCADLATNPAWGLAGNPSITGLTAVVTPAAALISLIAK